MWLSGGGINNSGRFPRPRRFLLSPRSSLLIRSASSASPASSASHTTTRRKQPVISRNGDPQHRHPGAGRHAGRSAPGLPGLPAMVWNMYAEAFPRRVATDLGQSQAVADDFGVRVIRLLSNSGNLEHIARFQMSIGCPSIDQGKVGTSPVPVVEFLDIARRYGHYRETGALKVCPRDARGVVTSRDVRNVVRPENALDLVSCEDAFVSCLSPPRLWPTVMLTAAPAAPPVQRHGQVATDMGLRVVRETCLASVDQDVDDALAGMSI